MSGAQRLTVLSPELAQIASRYSGNPKEVVPIEVREEYVDALASVAVIAFGASVPKAV